MLRDLPVRSQREWAEVYDIEAHEVIQRILGRPGSIILTRHARRRGADRSFDDDDVYRVLENGAVGANPDWDERSRDWIYRVSGRDLDGDALVLKVTIDPVGESIRVITGPWRLSPTCRSRKL